MRKNYTYDAKEPKNRNEFIDMIKNKEDVIVLHHNIIEELDKEINENIKYRKTGNFFSKLALPMAILSWSNPLGWFLSGVVFLCGGLEKSSDYFNQYNIYNGYDICLRRVLTFHLKDTVDLKYDKVTSPRWDGKIEYKNMKRRIQQRIQ